jgi:hypothetical protein
MEETLEASLAQIFGAPGRAAPAVARVEPGLPAPAPAPARELNLKGLADQAFQQFGKAQEMLRQGNFAAYGEELKRLESTLKALRERAK